MTQEHDEKYAVLAKYLEVDIDKIDELWYDDRVFTIDDKEYMVLNNEEAQIATLDHFMEESGEEVNLIIRALIINMDGVIWNAVHSSGRGHFLSLYDEEEIEIDGYFIYRMS